MDMQKHYSPEALERLRERQLSPQEQQRVEAAWQSLFADVESALGEDPAGERGKAIAVRWRALIAAFTGGDAEIERGLSAFYADRANWPASFRNADRLGSGPDGKIWEWAARAMRAHPA
jgi:TipAS antibiotic-recognition protein